jgi:hypothetical protein
LKISGRSIRGDGSLSTAFSQVSKRSRPADLTGALAGSDVHGAPLDLHHVDRVLNGVVDARQSALSVSGSERPLGSGLLGTRWPETDLLLGGSINFFWRKQYNRLRPDRAGGGSGKADGGGRRVVGQIHDEVDVRTTEGKVERLQSASETGDQVLSLSNAAAAAFVEEAPNAFGRISGLKQVLRHARHLLLGSLTSVGSQSEVHPRPPQAYAFCGGARSEQFPYVGDTNISSMSASAPAS